MLFYVARAEDTTYLVAGAAARHRLAESGLGRFGGSEY